VTIRVLTADLGPRVRAGFTRRAGGRSAGPYAGLNLGLHVGDDPGAVAANRELLAAWAGGPVTFPHQVHGTGVLFVGGAGAAGSADPAEDADAVVTAVPGTAVGVLVADCVPVLLADAEAGVAAAAHAGRQGYLAGVVEAALEAMEKLGARRGATRAAIGPAAGPCCYEVPAGMRDEAGAVRPAAPATTTWGTPSLDLPGGCAALLRDAGVASVTTVGGCTIEDDDSYSYRRAGVTGRFAGVVRIEP
jgi:YfiH family protein